jgi:hypothetical protein
VDPAEDRRTLADLRQGDVFRFLVVTRASPVFMVVNGASGLDGDDVESREALEYVCLADGVLVDLPHDDERMGASVVVLRPGDRLTLEVGERTCCA